MRAAAILPWIPVFPLIGFLVNGLLYLVSHSKLGGKDAPKGPHGHGDDSHDDHGHGEHEEIPFASVHSIIGPAACALSFLASLLAIAAWWGETHGHESIVATLWSWMPMGENATWFGAKALALDAAFRIDALSALMLFFVTLIGTLIHVYSVGYMGHDPGYGRYFSYLNLFMFAMLTLVLGASLPVMFVGWEGVGLCSYLLIGFYWTKTWAADAGKKAFVVNRIGDFGFVLGIFGCFALFGTTDFDRMFALASADPARYAAGGLMTAVCLALFIGACGKSAQIPLYVWLPDAMAGPTPVSALIHAATMVTAGVYMVARCNGFYRISHEWALKVLGEHPTIGGLLTHDASFVVAVVGGATALFAATMGLAQTDIKKVLAYSTVSQLGYMFLGCGALAFSSGMFHVFTHAWFKACLFLGAGSVIHALGGEQDMTKMGGLRKLIPHTFLTMFVATLAIAGVPGLAGFFSKDAILAETWGAGYKVLWALAVLTAGLTAFYMFRLIKMTFYGTFRGTPEQLKHVHESPASMTVPLYVLAAGAAVVGWLGIPKFILGKENAFESFLEPVILKLPAGWAAEAHEMSHSTEWSLMLTSVGVAFAGIGLAWVFYSGAYPFAMPARIAASLGGFYRLVRDKYRVDELYEAVFVNGLIKKGGRFLWEIDARVVDLIPNGAAGLALGLSHVSSWFDRTFVDGAVNGVGNMFQAAFRGMHRVQTGRAQNYALTMAVGIFGFVCLYLLLK
ncbi:MAG: NADH-quinone oxidoreductase subunit L [Acidobacteriota bacterium]|nr:NADH-quinone oxidoreductase subunit L [Acidobacteriota bacterium]